MIVRAFAKVNLVLRVLGRREDGYHQLETVFQSLALADDLVIEAADALSLEVDGDAPLGADNLVMRAALALAEAAGRRGGAALRLVKRIPTGGLGGGSSDAAAALVGLDRLWGTGAGSADLVRIAARLGADVPYFLTGGTAIGRGRGDEIEPVTELAARSVVLAFPGLHVATVKVFGLYDAGDAVDARRESHAGWDLAGMTGLVNDLEPTVFGIHPELRRLKEALIAAGAAHALVTGTGSTVYGLFTDPSAAERARTRIEAGGTRAVVTSTIGRAAYDSRRFA